MNITQLQTDKLTIINWITEIQDASIVEKIKSLMNSDDKPYELSSEQMQILEERLTEDRSNFQPARELLNDLQKKYGL